MKNQLSYIINRKFSISLVILVFLIATLSSYYLYFANQFQTTIYINFGAALSQNISPYETSESADFFSEMTQGWFKNPQFLKQVQDQTNIDPNFNVKKQEKQTLIVTFSSKSSQLNDQVTKQVQTQLSQFIATYNSANKSAFTLTKFDSSTEAAKINPVYLALLALIIGALLGYYSNRLYDYIFE